VAKLLLVDDDKRLTRALDDWLTAEGHELEVIHDGQSGLQRALQGDFDLLILDWNIPNVAGIDICKEYRESGGAAKVIMLTGKTAIHDRVSGLDAGADDYLTKPFNPEELSARVRAQLRRLGSDQKATAAQAMAFGSLRLEPQSKEFFKDDIPVKLNAKEFSLLEFLMRHPNQVFSANDILNKVWSEDSEVSPDTIRVYITRLRDKIDSGKDHSCIKTIHAVGYKFVPPSH
jgi:two-component system OmpR family response regulator